MTSLRLVTLASADVSDDEELRKILEMPLSADERRDIRARARSAAETMEQEAARRWDKFGAELSTEERLTLVRSVDQAKRLRAMADALEPR